jgi:hypothetical protein
LAFLLSHTAMHGSMDIKFRNWTNRVVTRNTGCLTDTSYVVSMSVNWQQNFRFRHGLHRQKMPSGSLQQDSPLKMPTPANGHVMITVLPNAIRFHITQQTCPKTAYTLDRTLSLLVLSWLPTSHSCCWRKSFFFQVRHPRCFSVFKNINNYLTLWHNFLLLGKEFEWSVLLTQYCAGGKIETNEMGRACGAYGGG